MIINKHSMPKTNMKFEKPLAKSRATTISENMCINKYKEDDNLECLRGEIREDGRFRADLH